MRFPSALLLLLLTGLTACVGVPEHHPVPGPEASQAVVTGFPRNIRFWADESPAFADVIIKERLDTYRAANEDYYKAHGAYPPLDYLAISGGANDGAFGAGFLSGWIGQRHPPGLRAGDGRQHRGAHRALRVHRPAVRRQTAQALHQHRHHRHLREQPVQGAGGPHRGPPR